MSVFPGDTTKQIFVAPAMIMRSTRYSLTARGRSTPSSIRLPTGRSSFEKASGWMRLPEPAAGMIPHIVRSPRLVDGGRLRRARDEDLAPWREELLESGPLVAQDRYAARRRFEQSARWTVSHFAHRAPRHVE